jgi:ribosomal protein L34
MGRPVWLKSYSDADHCTLREVRLDGEERRGPRPLPCTTRLINAGGMPLLVEQGSVVDPQTGTKFVPNGRVWAMTHGFIVAVAGEQGPITLVDRRSRERWRLRNPSQISGYQGGVDEAAVHPNGRLLALSFADPAFGRTQVTDVWLLDPARRRFQQLPDMPALVLLKFTSMSWASDGRLVILAESAGRNVVGVWRPSQRRIAVRRVSLPTRSGGSDSFVVWR